MTPPMTLLSHPKDMAPKQAYTHVSFYFSLMGLGYRDLVLIHIYAYKYAYVGKYILTEAATRKTLQL